MLIDHRDDVINICEVKFSRSECVVTRADEKTMCSKIDIFECEAKPGRALYLTMVIMEGCAHTVHYDAVVHSEVRMEDVIRARP